MPSIAEMEIVSPSERIMGVQAVRVSLCSVFKELKTCPKSNVIAYWCSATIEIAAN
jgi:hypothetical protein